MILAIDQGTSATKAVVISDDGQIKGSAEVVVDPKYGPGATVEHDPTALLASVIESGSRAIEQAKIPISAVGLANQGETVLAWDRATGQPLTPALVWQDRRAADICHRLDEYKNALLDITGLCLDPYFAAPKMLWIREHWTRQGVVTTTDAWLLHQLTGTFVTDASTASRTMLLDLSQTQWSEPALSYFAMSDENLPTIVDCAGVIGETTSFGTRSPVPVSGLAVDQQAALFAQRGVEVGDVKCTYGTGAFLLANAGTTACRSTSALATSVAWRLDGNTTYCLDGQVYTVGSAFRWLYSLGVINAFNDIDRIGFSVNDTGGVTMVPSFAGLAAPWWRADVRAHIDGIGLHTTSGHIVRAMIEGIAAQVADLVDATEGDLGTHLSSLRVDGGLTKSTLLMQTQADLLQVPVEVATVPDITAVGVGAFAHMGMTGRPQSVTARPPSILYEPQIDNSEAAERRELFRDSVAASIQRCDNAATHHEKHRNRHDQSV